MLLTVRVKPNARLGKLEPGPDGTWVAWVNAPAVEGKANARLIEIVADHFGVRKSNVVLVIGLSSRTKRLAIEGLELPESP
jgi:uncharacterized protein YggU (UPF0235/DUF167 family)